MKHAAGLAAILFIAATAQAGDASRTAAQLAQMTPNEIAKFADVKSADWVSKTIYPAPPVWHGHGVGAISLITRPVGDGAVCSVQIVYISFSTNEQGTPKDTTLYRATGQRPDRGFTIAQGDCTHTPIQPDFMKNGGAYNVFTMSSVEDVSLAATRFAGTIAAAHDAAKQLPFLLTCKSIEKRICDDPRGYLAKLNTANIENLGRCDGDDCIFAEGLDSIFIWRLEMTPSRVALKIYPTMLE